MRFTKESKSELEYLSSLKKINKMQTSPKNLSERNSLFSDNNQNSNMIQKDPLFNENVPIKVRLIKAAHLNPNINLGKIHKINKSVNALKKQINNNENTEKSKSKIAIKESNKNKVSKIQVNNYSKKINQNKISKEELKNLFPNNTVRENQGDIYKLKKFLISSKMMEEYKKPIKYINLNNINIKTHKYISKDISDTKDNYNRNTNILKEIKDKNK